MPARADVDLPIRIERQLGNPLHQQVAEALRQAIRQGSYPARSRLPSTRALAAALGVGRNVILSAFDELYAEGYIEARAGSGTFVAADLTTAHSVPIRQIAPSPRWPANPATPPIEEPDPPGSISFRLGVPAAAKVPEDVWRRMWREIADAEPPSRYRDPAGDVGLRSCIAAYLGRARGVPCSADDLVITTGASQAIDLVIQAVVPPGAPAAMEEPGYPTTRRLLQLRGARIVPIPIDDDGLRVSALPTGANAPLLVYVTPSHQYPIGVRMSIGRRLALLEWAAANDAVVIEDDYDGEFRFGAPSLPALAGLDAEAGRGRVAYVGTFSKVMLPGLRVGYLVAPTALRERVVALKRLTDHHTPWAEQQALAGFCARGDLERHIRRMRRLYAVNRAALAEALAPVADLGRLHGLEAGLHAFLELHPDIDPDRVVSACRARNVIVSTLADYYAGPPDRRGLLLGYGGLDLESVRSGATVLAEVMREAQSDPDPR